MDCYALGMEVMNGNWEKGLPGTRTLDSMARLMVEGMTAVKDAEDEKAFYHLAASACRECAVVCEREKAGLFRIYAAMFEELSKKEG
jgi:hypothetical protein